MRQPGKVAAYRHIDSKPWWYVKACDWHSKRQGYRCVVLCNGQEHRHFDELGDQFKAAYRYPCRCGR